MKFKVDGVTDEELEMLLNNDRIYNNIPIYNNKTITTDCYSSSKKTLTKEEISREVELKSILLNNNNIDLLYLLLEKRYTYFNELLKLNAINWKHYLNKLISLNIIEIKNVGQEIEDFLLFTKALNKGTIKQAKFFKLTSDAALEYGQDMLKNYVRENASDKVVTFVNEQKNLFMKSKEEIIQQKLHQEKLFKLRCKELGVVEE